MSAVESVKDGSDLERCIAGWLLHLCIGLYILDDAHERCMSGLVDDV